MDEQRNSALRVNLPSDRIQFRFRIYASQIPPSYSKASVSIMNENNEVLSSSSEASVRGGNCRWRETLKYENLFPSEITEKFPSHFLKFVVSKEDKNGMSIGKVLVDLSEFVQAGNGMLEQRSFLLENVHGNYFLNVTVQCSNLQHSNETTPTGNKGKGLVSLVRRSPSADNISLAERAASAEQSARFSDTLPKNPRTPPSTGPSHSGAPPKQLHPPANHHQSLEIETDVSSHPVPPRRSPGSDKFVQPRPQRASSVPVRFASEGLHFNDETYPASVDDLRAELKKAEEAIDELQAESVVWRKASRNLSKEVENLRHQLAEAMKQDRMAELEINSLVEERDDLSYELEKSNADFEDMDNELTELREKLQHVESELVVHKADVARLTLQAKFKADDSNLSSPSTIGQTRQEHGEEMAQLEPSASIKSDYQEAIEAIEELQVESVTWQTTSRTLSKEVVFLKKHLTEAVRQDQATESEVQELLQDREELKEDLEREKYDHEETRSTVKTLQEEVALQKEMIQVLMVQLKAFHGSGHQGQQRIMSPREKPQVSGMDSKHVFSRGLGFSNAV